MLPLGRKACQYTAPVYGLRLDHSASGRYRAVWAEAFFATTATDPHDYSSLPE